MSHTLVFTEETETNHMFVCSKCGQVIGFNKPGLGEPTADLSGEVPAAPAEAAEYLNNCSEE